MLPSESTGFGAVVDLSRHDERAHVSLVVFQTVCSAGCAETSPPLPPPVAEEPTAADANDRFPTAETPLGNFPEASAGTGSICWVQSAVWLEYEFKRLIDS